MSFSNTKHFLNSNFRMSFKFFAEKFFPEILRKVLTTVILLIIFNPQ